MRSTLLATAASLLVLPHRTTHGFHASPPLESYACATGLTYGDTARYTGIMSTLNTISFPSDAPKPPGSLKLWTDRIGRFHYAESWKSDTVTNVWDGEIGHERDQLPRTFVSRRTQNGVLGASEQVEQTGDSIVVTLNGKTTTERLARDVVRIPGLRSTPLIVLLAQCAASRPERELRTNQWGIVRVRELTSITLTSSSRSQPATLYLLSSESTGVLEIMWLHTQTNRLIALRGANGGMDLMPEGWESSLDQIVQAEVRAARPPDRPVGCANGVGPGGCEPHTLLISDACRDIPRRLKPRPPAGGIVTLRDSGYSVTSDGLGPYRSGSSNVRVSPVDVAAAFVLNGRTPGPLRTFNVNLDRPVPGDSGVTLGVIQADAAWPGPFMPDGSNYSVEIAFMWINSDTTEFTGDIPVGTTVRAGVGIGLDFYLNGVAHVLQTGAGAWGGFCSADGSAAHGDGTTTGTISHPTATSWVVDLPPGSVGRLWDISREVKGAVNRGLYYVSLHLTIQK